MEGVIRVLEKRIREKLESSGYTTYDISSRDGFVIFMAEANNKRLIIWIRNAPLTDKAIKLFTKIINKYEYDNIIILKTKNKADYIKPPQEFIIEKITDIDSIPEIINKYI